MAEEEELPPFFHRFADIYEPVEMEPEQLGRIPMIELEGTNDSRYRIWLELTWAMEGNAREMAWIHRKVMEIFHIMHFLGGLDEPFLHDLPEDGFTTWEAFGRLFLENFYTLDQYMDDIRICRQQEDEPFCNYWIRYGQVLWSYPHVPPPFLERYWRFFNNLQ
jgi:hypothetical protein